MSISASTVVAGVAGSPVRHSLSPTLHNAWIGAMALDAVYIAFEPQSFTDFARGLRGGAIRGLNVTAPFKQLALEISDSVSRAAQNAGAANLLIFEKSGAISADNTDGVGLLAALAEQAEGFDLGDGPALILGAGGAARGAACALLEAGAPSVRIANRTLDRARALAANLSGRVEVVEPEALANSLADASVVINATSADPVIPLESAPRSAVALDMIYEPLTTPFLARARARGLRTVDGLAMLIGQARPSFEALFGSPPPDIDVRSIAIKSLESRT